LGQFALRTLRFPIVRLPVGTRRSCSTPVRLALAGLALACAWGGSSAFAADEPPDASFAFFPSDPVSGEPVHFVSYACDPDGSLIEQAWDFNGDGITDASGTDVTTSFAAGSHAVSLRATPKVGLPVVRTQTVGVAPGSPQYVLPHPFDPPLLNPFPIVRMVGRFTETGVRVRFLSVRAPVCSRATVSCRGRGCPFRKRSQLVGRHASRIRPLAGKRLRAGVRLTVLVRKRDRVGKFTRFQIRRDRPPRRVDRCVRFGETTPIPCTEF
jgi:hypothetical protein